MSGIWRWVGDLREREASGKGICSVQVYMTQKGHIGKVRLSLDGRQRTERYSRR